MEVDSFLIATRLSTFSGALRALGSLPVEWGILFNKSQRTQISLLLLSEGDERCDVGAISSSTPGSLIG